MRTYVTSMAVACFGSGKDGNNYLVNRDNMGKFNSETNLIYQQVTIAIYQQVTIALPGGEFGMAAYFNNAIYYGSYGHNLKMFPFLNARLTGPSSQTLTAFAYPGTTPSVSANGTANGIVWAAENTDPAILHAYDAANLAYRVVQQQSGGERPRPIRDRQQVHHSHDRER
jgi:hypothetical protein